MSERDRNESRIICIYSASINKYLTHAKPSCGKKQLIVIPLTEMGKNMVGVGMG